MSVNPFGLRVLVVDRDGPPLAMVRRVALAAALFLLYGRVNVVVAQETPTSVSCDSEGELLANLQWVRDVCSQAGEPSFAEAEVDALVPSAVTTQGCAAAVRRIAAVCEGILARSPLWFATRKAALEAAVASAAVLPVDSDQAYHISDPNLGDIHTCGAALDDGFDIGPITPVGKSQWRVAIDVGPSRGNLRLSFEDLTLDKAANDNLRIYSDADQTDELRAIFHDDLPLTEPIDIRGSAAYILLVSDGASRRTSLRLIVHCVCEDQPSFLDVDGEGCSAYSDGEPKHPRCSSLLPPTDTQARTACPLACGACDAGPCSPSPCQNGGTCREAEVSTGHRRLQGAGDGDGYGGSGACTSSTVAARSDLVTAECCDEPTEDCSGGAPATCNSDCAAVLVPYLEDCQNVLRSSGGGSALVKTLQSAVQECAAPVYECICVERWSGVNCEVRHAHWH